MSRAARLCESPCHEGSRRIPPGDDFLELRAELRRPRDGSRVRTRTIRHLCERCGYALFEDAPDLLQTTLVGLEEVAK